MEVGSCFTYDQDTSLYYNYPDLSCIDGTPLPFFDTTTRKAFQKRDGKLVHVYDETVEYSVVRNFIGYNYDLVKIPLYDVNIVLLTVSAFVICLFMIIYRWFFRLRA